MESSHPIDKPLGDSADSNVDDRVDRPSATKLDQESPGIAARRAPLLPTPPVAQRRPRSQLREQGRRDALDAAHFLGLAALYADRKEFPAAFECIEMCRSKAPTLPYSYKLHGKLLLRLRRFDEAASQFYQALRYNPFDREVADCLGQIEYERKNFVPALAATVDAFLLLAEESSETASRLRRRVRTLKRLLSWDNETVLSVFQERQLLLGTAFDRLQWHRDLSLRETGAEIATDKSRAMQEVTAPKEAGADQRSTPLTTGVVGTLGAVPRSIPALPRRLRRAAAWSRLSEAAILALAAATTEEHHSAKDAIFEPDPDSIDLFLIERGRAILQRPTSYGDLRLGEYGPGDLFGETALVDGLGHVDRAEALEPCTLLRIDGHLLERRLDQEPEIGVEVFAGLWQALSTRLRGSNARLDDFFHGRLENRKQEQPSGAKTEGQTVPLLIASQDKVRLFREQGLARNDLLALATYARERHYTADKYLFRQGDPGSAMFFVVNGKVRISRLIPGAGEEALAILGRGEFFGEMSLVDGQPRSADAKCHQGPVTVLELDRQTINEALRMDPRSALTFQRLMCRILASRLREIGDKLALWQILDQHG